MFLWWPTQDCMLAFALLMEAQLVKETQHPISQRQLRNRLSGGRRRYLVLIGQNSAR